MPNTSDSDCAPNASVVNNPTEQDVADRTAELLVWYRDHSRAVFNLAQRVCGRGHAEDVTQEVFLRLWRHPERFDPTRGSLRTFLLTMTHSCAVDAVRSSGSRRKREHRVVRLSPVPDVALGDRGEADERCEKVRAALDTLRQSEKEAIVTAFYGECSYRDAAVVLQEAEGTIKSLVRTGLRRLAPLLADLRGQSNSPS